MDPHDQPWSEHETSQRVDLLAEVLLKAGHSPSRVLLGVIRDSGIQVRWNDLVLPNGERLSHAALVLASSRLNLLGLLGLGYCRLRLLPLPLPLLIPLVGRSLASCHRAFEDLAAQVPPSEYRHPVPPPAAPIMYPATSRELTQKRPHPESFTPIQPRPSQPPYMGIANQPAYTTTISPSGEPASKKKRGRPPKAVTEARRQEAQAKGEPYPQPRKSRPSITARDVPQIPTGGPISYAQTPPSAPLPAPTTGATTPQGTQPPEQSTESSSGKKKSKPAPLELGSPDIFGPATADQSQSQAFSNFTPNSAPFSSSTRPDSEQHMSHLQYGAQGPSPRQSLGSESRDVRMEGVEETQPRTTTPHSFKDTVGI
ncbi:hypothetical protein N0V90_010879 [Kalmusia sp. IMI 367209]|nr:hypothetical protein N0V90_010879 [Kalmusia sp. IMI 367209]